MRRPTRSERGIVLKHLPSPPDLADICLLILERQDTVTLGPAIDFPGVNPILHFVLSDSCGVRNYRQDVPFEPVPRAAVWGSQTCIHEMRFDSPMFVISAVLTLDGAARLTGHPVSALVDKRVTLHELGLNSSDLLSRLMEAQTFPERAAALVDWLRAAMSVRRHRKVGFEFDYLASGRMQGSIASFAQDLGVTTRGLHKRAIREIGLSPKTIQRYARLQMALRYCHPNTSNAVDTEELLLQFHDRSHFLLEFRKLTGLTPREYRQAKQRTGDKLVSMVYLDSELLADREGGRAAAAPED